MNPIAAVVAAYHDVVHSLYPMITPEQRAQFQCTLNADAQRQGFGDLSSNAALIIAKAVGKNPRAVAQELVAAFRHESVSGCDIAGPGFINIRLADHAFVALARGLFEQGAAWFHGVGDAGVQNYSIEFVSANPTGPLHIGHGRNGIVGDVLARIARFLGHSVTAEFYINDAGAQIEKLGTSLRVRCEQLISNPDAQIPEEGYHGEYLIELAQELIARDGAAVLEHPDAWFGAYAKQILLDRIRQTLDQYRIHFDVWFSELTLHQSGAVASALELLQARGHLYEQDGALWFRATAFGDDKDRVVRRSNGEYTYLAADIAYLVNKLDRGFEQIVIVLGQDHHSYVVRLKAIMEALGHNPDRLHGILYQLVTLKNEGELLRLSKRAGRIVGLKDIIENVGADVARFFYLNRKADAHLELDLSLALKRTDDNPVYYLQYAYVRGNSILAKAATCDELKDLSVVDVNELGDAEKLLLKKVASLQHTLQHIVASMHTHMLAYYTLELANLFHTYYAHHRIVAPHEAPQSRTRLVVTSIVTQTLGLCFELLGLSAPQSM